MRSRIALVDRQVREALALTGCDVSAADLIFELSGNGATHPLVDRLIRRDWRPGCRPGSRGYRRFLRKVERTLDRKVPWGPMVAPARPPCETRHRRRISARRRGAGRPRGRRTHSTSRGSPSGDPDLADEPAAHPRGAGVTLRAGADHVGFTARRGNGRRRPRGIRTLHLSAERVALTRGQIEAHELPTAPAKATDSRSASWDGGTCQLEALAPDVLAGIVEGAIRRHLDLDVLDRCREAEREDRAELLGLPEGAG